MRLLANENIPLLSVQKLRAAGIDGVAVAEILPGAPDRAVLQWAQAHDCLLVTFDRDYGALLYAHRLPAPAGVIYLRFVPVTPEEPADALLALRRRTDLTLTGRFTVVDRQHIRQRPLPS